MPETSAVRKFAPTYLAIVILSLSPVWLVGYFVNQDGSAHANNAWIMLRLIAGDPVYTQLFQLNTFALPNSIGHWLLSLLLLLFSPFLATKLMVSGIFAAFVLGAGFLRYQIAGEDGVRISMLIGAAAAFNWLWLVGFYNFSIGVAIVLFTTGLFVRWRNELTIPKTLALTGLLLVAYFSHLIAVAVLGAAIAMLSLDLWRRGDRRAMAMIAAGFVPLLPLIYLFRMASSSSDMGISPTWRALDSPLSPLSWIRQALNADPFIVMSRRILPLTDIEWSGFAAISPIVWIWVAIVILIAGTIAVGRREHLDISSYGYLALFVLLVMFALFGPDDFGSEHGGVLRQRLMIFGVLFFIPVFRSNLKPLFRSSAAVILSLVLAYQTAALWDYARYSDRVTREYVAASERLPGLGGVASITVVDNALRYHSSPVTMINNFSGIGRNLVVWDNYELGHYLFPVVAKDPADKQFAYLFTRNSAILADVPRTDADSQIEALDVAFADNGGRIETLMVWRDHPGLDGVISKYFESEPFYKSENIRLFRRKTN